MKILMVLFFVSVSANAVVASDVSEVNRVRIQHVKAVNDHDADRASASFTLTGDWLSGDGVMHRGKSEIKTAFRELFQQHPKLTVRLSPTSTRFLSSTVVIEDGRFRFSNGPARSEGRYTAVLVKDNDEWLVVSVRNYSR